MSKENKMLKLFIHIKKLIIKKRIKLLFLVLIMVVGIFLRTYHFRDWLFFWDDQVRDVYLAEGVVKGKTSWPLLGPGMLHTTYDLGPMYYYLQIISGKLFGVTPNTVAYPDLLFSILTIPLLWFFLKKYFSSNLSLALTGIYSVSYFSIWFSRFAWNTNLIPFFSLLFLLSLHEFVWKKEKTKWIWLVFLGISIGVGIQLHALVLILMFATAFLALVYLMKNNLRLWKKWAIVILVILILNTGPIISDLQTNFANTKAFFSSATNKAGKSGTEPGAYLSADLNCHLESNLLIASSFGGEIDDCGSFYTGFFSKISNFSVKNWTDVLTIFLGILFSLLGYWSLVYYFRKEVDSGRKYFLGLMILYGTLSFLILLTVGDALKPRYFMHVFFMPFLFLGFFVTYLISRFSRKRLIIFIIGAVFVGANSFSLGVATYKYSNKFASQFGRPILGELDLMADYMQEQVYPEKEFYFAGKSSYAFTFSEPLRYVSRNRGLSLVRADFKKPEAFQGKPFFYIVNITKKFELASESKGYEVIAHKQFGQMMIYRLKSD
jgi:4-amino-4-deoxy-L-arabinose transferase-like glycosyltransferase